MTKRILILNDDGTAEVGGVMCKLVPVEPTWAITDAWNSSGADDTSRDWMLWDRGTKPDWEQWSRDHAKLDWNAMLSAAAIDLSGLPEAPILDVMRRDGK